jgi:hypothetical protein
MPPIPPGFVDNSRRTDFAPSFENREIGLVLLIDQVMAYRKADGGRFILQDISASGTPLPGLQTVTDDWDAVLAFIESRTAER